MPLQLFAKRHPEFDFYWNWEMDVRYTGHYHSLLSNLARWARKQPLEDLWERNARFQIDPIHGPSASSNPQKKGVGDRGIGDETDLISLFPLFEISGTLWPHRNYIVNYNETEAAKPRRGTVNTNMRLSARLLSLMHQENQDLGRSMMSEMWPPTLALHNDLKAVYAPHPMYLDRRWPAHVLQKTFNAGPGGQVGGSLETVINQEHDFAGSTWFWDAVFPLQLYERWLGLPDKGIGSPSVSTFTPSWSLLLHACLTAKTVGSGAWRDVSAPYSPPPHQKPPIEYLSALEKSYVLRRLSHFCPQSQYQHAETVPPERTPFWPRSGIRARHAVVCTKTSRAAEIAWARLLAHCRRDEWWRDTSHHIPCITSGLING